jgi:hypothetical protein
MTRKLFALTLALAYGFSARLVWAGSPSITLLKTIDYPAAGASTVPFGINNSNALVGAVTFSSGITAGFERQPNGTITELINPAGDGTYTQTVGLNDSGEIDGYYKNGATQQVIGFTLQNGVYSDYKGAPLCTNGVPCVADLNGLNNAGVLAGEWYPSATSRQHAFATLHNTFTSLTVPNSANGSAAEALSNNGAYITGISIDKSNPPRVHGFLYVASKNQAQSIDDTAYPSTLLFGVNNQEVLTGRVIDAAGVGHGAAWISGTWVIYDYPGATFTTLIGVNDLGIATGMYTDSAGINHGLLLKVALGS